MLVTQDYSAAQGIDQSAAVWVANDAIFAL